MLLSSTQKIQVVLAGAITTAQLPVVAGWADMLDDASTLAPGSLTTATNSTTAVDVVAAPATGSKRQLKYFSVYNADTVAATLTVRIDDAATARIVTKVTLAVGSRLEYAQGLGFRILDSTGALSGTGGGGGSAVIPSGTGFTHITAGVQDAAAKLVDTADVTDKAVTLAKLADVGTATVFYRKTAATGVPEVQSLATLKTDLGLTGTNSGDQASIVGITGTIAQFNTALTDGDFATGGGSATGTNTGDQTSVTGNAGTATALQAASADRIKLDGIATGATANSSDETLLARANHTGTQAISTITNLQTTLDGMALLEIPQNSRSAAYTLVLTDSGKHILHPSADTVARTFTIPASSSVAYPIGTALTFVNQNAGGVVTIAITTDTMRLAGPGTTGSRTLAANGIATAIKLTATEWIISGTGLT